MADQITTYLTLDHARLHAELDAARAGGGFHEAPFGRFRAGLLRHIGLEEKLLFPAVKRAAGALPEPVERLRVEHHALTLLLVPTPDLALAEEIEALLERHDAREEGAAGVYALCEAALAGAASRELAIDAEARPTPPSAPHFDGPRAHRTAASALVAAERARRRR